MSGIPVSILPSHPAEGWMSMNRYWEALDAAMGRYEGTEFSFSCPLDFQGICTPREGKYRLALKKGIVYPLQVRRSVRSGIAHILDHSYAFLLKSVPAGVRTIVTVHDLLPLREPEGLGPAAIERFRARVEWVKRADLILSDSVATRDDLIDLIGADGEKIAVLPLGADAVPAGVAAAALPAEVGGWPYVFSIGGFMKRKNLGILPETMARVREHLPDVRLVRAGARFPDSLRAEFHARCGPDALVELGQVSDAVLDTLYQNARATIIPSRYEGFGLPVLEAMARGCPVISAGTSSLPEVGGDAAIYFNVDEPAQAAEQLLAVLTADEAARGRIRAGGLERAAAFTWQIHFDRLLRIYSSLAAGA